MVYNNGSGAGTVKIWKAQHKFHQRKSNIPYSTTTSVVSTSSLLMQHTSLLLQSTTTTTSLVLERRERERISENQPTAALIFVDRFLFWEWTNATDGDRQQARQHSTTIDVSIVQATATATTTTWWWSWWAVGLNRQVNIKRLVPSVSRVPAACW